MYFPTSNHVALSVEFECVKGDQDVVFEKG